MNNYNNSFNEINNTEAANAIEKVIISIYRDKEPTIEQIEEKSKGVLEVYDLSPSEEEKIIKKVKSRFTVKVSIGAVLRENYKYQSWFPAKKAKIEFFYSNRYERYLSEISFSTKVIKSMSDVSDTIVDLLGNPDEQNSFARRGLVIGDVQSGKTANYISVITKAADAGYKVIFLLTGMQKNLRSQTQERIDSGFLGFDTSKLLGGATGVTWIGVGTFGEKVNNRRPLSMTTVKNDFNKSFAESLVVSLQSLDVPIIFVVKKNTSVLKNIFEWIKSTSNEEELLGMPMLMIDDEADQASINTKNSDQDPTIINQRIRGILSLFKKHNYVGFTATPFANVFIEPTEDKEMLENDLFPRDFIYSLEAPSNYISPTSIFSGEGEHKYMLVRIGDVGSVLPIKHKKDFELNTLPKTLQEAISLFLLSNAIRDCEGDSKSHRSMLVQMSRFIAVQENIAVLIVDYVTSIQRKVKNYPYKSYSQKPIYEEFKRISMAYYGDTIQTPIDDVLSQLNESIQPIRVTSVNMRQSASLVLNYKNHELEGLRVIAVGGQVLSRGLTLEGLTISYFYRNSRYYDTLMQMGRWFGYREDYANLCRVFMTDDAIDWYSYIAGATAELKNEIYRMTERQETPNDFGLKVKTHPGTLLITAPNKIRSGKDYRVVVSLSADVIETPRLYRDKDITRRNFNALEKLLEKISPNESESYSGSRYPFFKNVDKETISNFLSSFRPHKSSVQFQSDQISEFLIKDTSSNLKKWDVVVSMGSVAETVLVQGYNIKPVSRQYLIKDSKVIQVSGTNNRLGDPGITRAGLTDEQIKFSQEGEDKERLLNNSTAKSYSAKTYVKYLENRNPLLIIYVVKLSTNKDSNSKENCDGETTLGISLAFPKAIGESIIYIDYKLNSKAFKEFFPDYEEQGDE